MLCSYEVVVYITFLKRIQPLGMTLTTMKYQNYLSMVFRRVPNLLREYKNHITQYNPGTIGTNGGTFTVYKSLGLAKCFQLVVAVEMNKPGLFVDSILTQYECTSRILRYA